MKNTTVASTKSPFRYVYDQKHFATRVYFYFKDYENVQVAETACYEHRKSCTSEVYADHSAKGYYFFL